MDERGKIHNLGRYKQPVDFSGLRWGTITPTDIDGFIDFKNKLFIYFELKLEGKKIDGGQRLAMERLCDRCEGKPPYNGREIPTYGIIAEHNIKNVNEVIDAAKAIVIEYRCDNQWHIPKDKYCLKKLIDELRKGRNL